MGYGERETQSERKSERGCNGGRERDEHNRNNDVYRTHSALPSHYRQAATLVDPPVPCSKEDVLSVEVGTDLALQSGAKETY